MQEKISLPGSANAAEQMNALQAQGKGDLDFISVLTLYELLSGRVRPLFDTMIK
jgi:3-hydroxyisobutyrate dehydrogenase-like beta-hydroxyacid dehydrogenase